MNGYELREYATDLEIARLRSDGLLKPVNLRPTLAELRDGVRPPVQYEVTENVMRLDESPGPIAPPTAITKPARKAASLTAPAPVLTETAMDSFMRQFLARHHHADDGEIGNREPASNDAILNMLAEAYPQQRTETLKTQLSLFWKRTFARDGSLKPREAYEFACQGRGLIAYLFGDQKAYGMGRLSDAAEFAVDDRE